MFSAKQRIEVKLEKPIAHMDGNNATAAFCQVHVSNDHHQTSEKTLVLIKREGTW